ncbi:hypothetical protein [Streptomyces sp. CB03238]|uniref:hypothetical protein n=1 Tax=Streptomyces sp. CB03238 TaxID=1907777 RepID=UPI0011817261|nr:hypothetical protein [Streptomyces sp. CB03238]
MTSVIPRSVSYDVLRPLDLPQKLFSDGMAVVYADGTRNRDGVWTVSVKARHDGRSLGKIKTAAAGQENANLAVIQWVRDHCKEPGLRILSADKTTAHLPELGKGRGLARFVIDGESERELESLARVLFEASEEGQRRSEEVA